MLAQALILLCSTDQIARAMLYTGYDEQETAYAKRYIHSQLMKTSQKTSHGRIVRIIECAKLLARIQIGIELFCRIRELAIAESDPGCVIRYSVNLIGIDQAIYSASVVRGLINQAGLDLRPGN